MFRTSQAKTPTDTNITSWTISVLGTVL